MKNIKNQSKINKAQREAFQLFKGNCGLNEAHKAAVFHEIIPKSLLPNSWWENNNIIPLCVNCHEMIHAAGAKTYKDKLTEIVNVKCRERSLY